VDPKILRGRVYLRRETLSLKASLLDEDVCEAVDCRANATIWITVKAGQHRTICLHLCNDCVCKFEVEAYT
jgi:hypothetical protein